MANRAFILGAAQHLPHHMTDHGGKKWWAIRVSYGPRRSLWCDLYVEDNEDSHTLIPLVKGGQIVEAAGWLRTSYRFNDTFFRHNSVVEPHEASISIATKLLHLPGLVSHRRTTIGHARFDMVGLVMGLGRLRRRVHRITQKVQAYRYIRVHADAGETYSGGRRFRPVTVCPILREPYSLRDYPRGAIVEISGEIRGTVETKRSYAVVNSLEIIRLPEPTRPPA
jgi:hypothetical protein